MSWGLQAWLVGEREKVLSDLVALHAPQAGIQSRVVIGSLFTEVIRQVLREGAVKAYVKAVERRHEENLYALMRETTDRLGPEAARYLKPHTHLVKGSARKEIPALVRNPGRIWWS